MYCKKSSLAFTLSTIHSFKNRDPLKQAVQPRRPAEAALHSLPAKSPEFPLRNFSELGHAPNFVLDLREP